MGFEAFAGGWREEGHADKVGIDFLRRNSHRKACFPMGVAAQSVHIVSRCTPSSRKSFEAHDIFQQNILTANEKSCRIRAGMDTGDGKSTMEERRLTDEERRRRRIRMERRRKLRKKRRMQRMAIRTAFFAVLLLTVIAVVIKVVRFVGDKSIESALAETVQPKVVGEPPDYQVQLLTVNDYSRPGEPLEQVHAIVIHYTANPGTTAQQNRDYFEGLKDSHITSASSHFVIGLEGEIIQCIPCNEVAYASNERNHDSIAIECCIEDDTGKFNPDTYRSLVHLTAWLCGRYDLTATDVIRHYDITGKLCPKYYVEHEEAWTQFREDVEHYIEQYGIVPDVVSEE